MRFSYLWGGSKYDLVVMENAASPVLLKNGRLLGVLPPDVVAEFERKVGEDLKNGGLPFEHGVGRLHTWLLAKRSERVETTTHESLKAGDVAEGAAAGVILAPIAPVLLAGGVCAVGESALSSGERDRAQWVNQSLLESGPSYEAFLGRFKRHDYQVANGPYQIREYLATDGAFFTGRDFFYEVGFRNGRPLWVMYKNDAVRMQMVRYGKLKAGDGPHQESSAR